MPRIQSVVRRTVKFLDSYFLALKKQPIRRFLWKTFFGVMVSLTIILGILTFYDLFNTQKILKKEYQAKRLNFIQQAETKIKQIKDKE